MPKICDCSSAFANTGVPSCSELFSYALKLIVVPYRDSSGNIASISDSDVLDAAYFTSKINAANRLDRWYPMPAMEEVTDEREDPVTQDFDTGNSVFIRDGVRNFSAFLVNQPTKLVKQLNQIGCNELGVFIVDSTGAIQGNGSVNGELRPIRVNKNTWISQYRKATATTAAGVEIEFQYDLVEDDGDLKQINASEMSGEPLQLNGLFDLFGEITAGPSQTELTVKITTCFGTFLNPEVVEGLLQADFDVWNETDGVSAVPSAVVESSPGVYVITYGTQDVSDVLHVRVSKDGFDDTELRSTTGTVS